VLPPLGEATSAGKGDLISGGLSTIAVLVSLVPERIT
jgi:hypothetical protein